VGGRARRQRDEEGELTTAGAADEPDAPGIDSEPPSVGTHPAHARGDVGAGGGMLVVRSLAKVQRHHDRAAGGQRSIVRGPRRSIVAGPRAAVDVHERGHRAAGFGLRPVDAREQLDGGRACERHVGLFNLVRPRRIELTDHGSSRVGAENAR
jgi:hypothetical protein